VQEGRSQAQGLDARRIGLALAISLITPIALAFGPSVASAYIYFASEQPDGSGSGTAIGRANLDATEANENFLFGTGPSAQIDGPWGVAVNGTHIYWSDYNSDSISRANLDGTEGTA
jgi:hypothetical protein